MRSPIAAGIDVGGLRKGFHAVVLRGGAYLSKLQSPDPTRIAAWVRDMDARIVAVDAPCAWRMNREMRPAERDLAGLGIRCFATPTRSAARHHPFYAWMRNGMRLYAALARHYPLIRWPAPAHGRLCVETFPHGIATVLAGRPLRARTKHPDRLHILQAVGIDTAPLDSMDFLDAALCALAAHRYLRGRAQVIGDAEQGYLVLPSARLPSNQSQKLRRG